MKRRKVHPYVLSGPRTDAGRLFHALATAAYRDADAVDAGPERRTLLREAAAAMQAMRRAEAEAEQPRQPRKARRGAVLAPVAVRVDLGAPFNRLHGDPERCFA